MLRMSYNYVVLIQIHDEAEKLAKCVESLEKQKIKPSGVIVVDDGTPNNSVYDEYLKIVNDGYIPLEYCQAARPKKPNLDTVGKAIFQVYMTKIFYDFLQPPFYDYLSIIDVDSLPMPDYYKRIIHAMNKDDNLVCASGIIKVGNKEEKLINDKVIKRKDARGSGKVIRTDFLASIPLNHFPQVAWDTWINTKAKIRGKKTRQINGVYLYSIRATTRINNRDNFRDGRLSYHFGYNPLLVLYKILFRGRDVWKGYRDAKKKNWRLSDKEVRKYFGWRYLFRFWK